MQEEEGGRLLLFNPATDVELIEDVFEFDETIERPETIRFFTLQEQQQDFLEKLLPKVGRIPKKKLQESQHELDMFTSIYNGLLEETPDGFRLREPEPVSSLPWIQYYNEAPFAKGENAVLFCNPLQRGVNYYTRLLASLPKKAVRFDGEPLESKQKVRIETPSEPFMQLPAYTRTRTYFRDDGSYYVEEVPQEGTEDAPKFTGYRIYPLPLPPPNPISDHPFLSGHKEPKLLDSTEPLSQLLPALGTILDHAVPQTSDPYTEGAKYLKLFDIRLSQIPWKEWKRAFPPVPLIQDSPAPIEIALRESTEPAPSQMLQDAYKSTWYPAIAPRHWLSLQVDGGQAMRDMLLSSASEGGILAVPPPNPLPEMTIPGTSAECVPNATSFELFAAQGVYRQTLKEVKKDWIASGQCIPLAAFERERQEALFANRLPWEAVSIRIPPVYQEPPAKEETKPPSAFPAELPELRQFILTILQDEDKADLDKVDDIRLLLENATLSKALYTDRETGDFLICEHTLTLLQQGLDDEFRRNWLVQTGGSLSCKFCGEAVQSEILVDQDEFDEAGHVQTHAEAFTVTAFHGTTIQDSLAGLSDMFNKSPAEELFYLILTLLQVLPAKDQLQTILGYIRQLHGMKSYKDKTEGQRQNYSGVFGFCGAVTLLLTHEPALIPRRRFGSKPIELRGFPRDTTSVEDAPLVNGLLFALRSTFEAYPTTLKGPSATFLRTLMSSPGDQRKLIFAVLSSAFLGSDARPTPMTPLLKHAKTVEKEETPLMNEYTAPVYRPPTRIEAKPNYRCPGVSPFWATLATRAGVRQASADLTEPILPNPLALPVPRETDRIDIFIPAASTIPSLKFSPKSKFYKELLALETPAALQTVVLRAFSLLRIDTGFRDLHGLIREYTHNVEFVGGDFALVRDYLLGVLRLLLSKLNDAGEVLLKGDPTIRAMLISSKDAKETVTQLRARERETLKKRLKAMSDVERDITKQLLDRGLVPFLITREDRELFAKKQEEETVEEEDIENIQRIDGAQGEVPVNQNGQELELDQGDYGDHQARTGEGEEYQIPVFNDEYDAEQY
jgi:hypothetical protein